MNGWQRLFCFMVVVVTAASLGLWVTLKPSDSFITYGCDSPYSATAKEARAYLASNLYSEHDYATEPRCLRALEAIASGETARKYQAAWMNDLRTGAITLAVLFAVIYMLGYGLGWVWRGFFPTRASPGE